MINWWRNNNKLPRGQSNMKRILFLLLVMGLVVAQLPVDAKGNTRRRTRKSAAARAAAAAAAQQQAAATPEAAQPAAEGAEAAPAGEGFVAPRESVSEKPAEATSAKRVFKPKRDPTLSPDDVLLLDFREKQRLAAIAAERKRQEDEEKRKREEEEKQRLRQLYLLKHPEAEVQDKIHIGGIIGQEVFIGSKIYTVGNTIYGARIVSVSPDSVEFSYKGRTFVRKVKL